MQFCILRSVGTISWARCVVLRDISYIVVAAAAQLYIRVQEYVELTEKSNRINTLLSRNINHPNHSATVQPAIHDNTSLPSFSILHILVVWDVIILFWELPLWYMSSFNRINPRLYDVFFLLGLLIFQKKIFTISCDNKVYNIWKKIVVWFCICAVFYAMIESLDIVMYSILCVTRYIQGLLVIKMFLLLPHNQVDKALNRCCWIGLIVLSLYCLFELKSGTGSQIKEIEIAPGKFVNTYGNVLFGPLSFSYFHLGQLIPLAFVIVACQAIRKIFIYFSPHFC